MVDSASPRLEREIRHFVDTVSKEFGLDIDGEFRKVMASSVPSDLLQSELQLMIRRFGPMVMTILDVPPLPGTLRLTVSDDRLTASVSMDPPLKGGAPVGMDQVESALREAGVCWGVDGQKIAAAVEHGRSEAVRNVLIASGRLPVDGEDARIERIRTGQHPHSGVGANAAVFIPTAELDQARDGEAVARYLPQTSGAEGTDVFGAPVPARPGRAVQIQMGPNVRFDESEKIFYATRAGRVAMSPTDISVENILEVDGDMDIAAGHTRFDGELHVKGYIRSNLTVTVDGDIVVDGGVEAARVSSVGGSILIRHGFQGGGYGMIQALYDITAKFIDQGNVMAGGCVTAESILHSEVAAGESVSVVKNHGMIIGGRVFGGESLDANELGSPAGTPTEIDMGLRPAELARLAELKRKRAEAERAYAEAEQALKDLGFTPAQAAAPSPEMDQFRDLAKLVIVLSDKRRKITEQENKFIKTLSRRPDAEVHVRGTVHPGVIIRIGAAVYHVRDPLRRVRFLYDKSISRIQAAPLRGA